MSIHLANRNRASNASLETAARLDQLLGLHAHIRPAVGTPDAKPDRHAPRARTEERPILSLQATSRRLQEADATDALMLSRDVTFLRATSPDEKAELIKKLGRAGWSMGPIVGAERGCAVRDILATCKSKDELERVFQMLGGKKRLLSFIKDDRVRGAIEQLESFFNDQLE